MQRMPTAEAPDGQVCALCLWDGPLCESRFPGWDYDYGDPFPRWEDSLYDAPFRWVVRIRRAFVGPAWEFKICPPCLIENQRIQNIRMEPFDVHEDASWYYVVYGYDPTRLSDYEDGKDFARYLLHF